MSRLERVRKRIVKKKADLIREQPMHSPGVLEKRKLPPLGKLIVDPVELDKGVHPNSLLTISLFPAAFSNITLPPGNFCLDQDTPKASKPATPSNIGEQCEKSDDDTESVPATETPGTDIGEQGVKSDNHTETDSSIAPDSLVEYGLSPEI
jgi:hypothetical protein